jgi:hypothetical protein
MSDVKLGFLEQITGVLYRPKYVFSRVSGSDLLKGLLLMILMTFFAVYSSMNYMSKIPLSVISPQLEGSMAVFVGIGTGITIIVGWVAVTILLHGLGVLSGGGGTMKRFFAMHGFASVPVLLNQLIRVMDSSFLDSSTLTSFYLAYRDIDNKLLKALLGTNLLNIWGLATFALLIVAVEENYEVNRTRAFLIVLLPSVIHLLINYFTI